MNNLIGFVLVFFTLVSLAVPGLAETDLGPEDFDDPTVIDFEDAPSQPIGDRYKSASRVTFVNLKGGFTTNTGNGSSKSACNYAQTSMDPYLAGEALFDDPVIRAGLYISTRTEDTPTIVTAYLNNVEVGSKSFVNGGWRNTGSFAAIEIAGGFDKITIAPTDNGGGGQFCMDNFQFDGFPPTGGGGGANGDPHFKTWQGQHYDYHGECDLVLLHSSEFGSGLGLDVHIRTKLRRLRTLGRRQG
jgi:hypothetical protein